MNKTIDDKNQQTHLVWFFLFSLFFFVVYLLMNSKTAFLNDDYTYRLVFEYWRVSANPVKVSSLHDIYVSMVNHYMLWGGRIPVHAVIQLLMWLVDKKVFDIINSLMVMLLGLLAYLHVNFGRKRNFVLFVYIFTGLWFFIPQPELTMLNLTNSVNNMWVCVYVLLFLIPYRIILTRDTPLKQTVVLTILSVPLGFLAGWSNEPGGAAAGAMAVLVIAYLLKTGKKPPVWAYTGVAALASGWATMTFAPGYRVKADKYYGVDSVLQNFIENFGNIESNLLQVSFKSLWPLLLTIIIALSALYRLRKLPYANSRKKPAVVRKKIMNDSFYIPELLYLFCAFASISIYTIAPEFWPRYLFPATTFLLISAGIVLSRVLDEKAVKDKVGKYILSVLIAVCFVSVAVSAAYEYSVASYNSRLNTAIVNDIKTQVSQGNRDVVVKGEFAFLSTGRYNIYKYDFINLDVIWGSRNPEDEINRMFAANYGADTYVNEAAMSFTKSK